MTDVVSIDVPRRERRSRRVLAPLATLLAAGALVMGSGASFTSQSENPANVYATGSLTQDNSKANAAIFDVVNLKPGDTVAGEVTITNSGSLPAVFSLSETADNGFVTESNLQMRISEVGGGQVFAGTFGTAGVQPLGTFAAGEARTYRFSVVLDAGAGNAEQGRTATADYVWDAVQTDAVAVDQPAGEPATRIVANR
jgi:spore coat-associated protein N